MVASPTLAQTLEEISTLRSAIFIAGADEIAKIDTTDNRSLVRGRIGVPLDAINSVIGKSERELARIDPRKISLLTEALEDVLRIKIRCVAHLFNELKKRMCEENHIYGKKLNERRFIEQYVRRIGEKLLNGHAGTEI